MNVGACPHRLYFADVDADPKEAGRLRPTTRARCGRQVRGGTRSGFQQRKLYGARRRAWSLGVVRLDDRVVPLTS